MNHPIHALLVLWWALLLPVTATATCFKVTKVGTADTASDTEIRPGEGAANNWLGACQSCNGSLGLPTVINVNNDGSFLPYGTLIAGSVAPFTQYGASAGYNSEHVFFRCAPEDAVYEMYSTNGDDLYSGYSNGGDAVGNDIGLHAAYRTAWPNVLLRLTHVETGEFITHVWKQRQLSGLDLDSRGFQLVKAKNLSAIRAELFSAPLEFTRFYWPTTPSQLYTYPQPAAYLAIKGPGLLAPTAGQSHAVNNAGGWYFNWPGAISLYRNVTLKRYPTCAVLTVTPHVVFPPISVGELNSGSYREMSLEVTFKCQGEMVSSTAANGTALGIRVSTGSLAASFALGLTNTSGGLSYLVSDRYGEPGIAQGVGVRLYRNGNPMNLLADENSADGANAEAVGWYPVVESVTRQTSSSAGVDQYSETFRARLEKLTVGAQPTVTPGQLNATAQVVIRVQ